MENKINIPFPKPGEYPEYYATYYKQINPQIHIFDMMEAQRSRLIAAVSSLSNEKQHFRYAEGKWSVLEVLGHCIDTERIFGYRVLGFVRGETQSLPGYDENIYVAEGNFNKRSLESLIKEFNGLREANLALFESLSEEDFLKTGIANNREMKVNALVYLIPAHLEHHMQILKERYGITGV
ncbi:DinB family protein [Ignavibacteriales bacterium]